LTASGDISWIN